MSNLAPIRGHRGYAGRPLKVRVSGNHWTTLLLIGAFVWGYMLV